MSRANLPAAPTQWSAQMPASGPAYMTGLTIREHFAGLAMQGLCAGPERPNIKDVAEAAVMVADALLAALATAKAGE